MPYKSDAQRRWAHSPAGVKAFLNEMDLIENELRLPLVPLSDKYHQEVKEHVASNK